MTGTARAAIVTGAGSGIGAAAAATLASNGWSVALADLNGDDLAEVADRLRRQGLSVSAAKVDVTCEGDLLDLTKRTARDLGRLDTVVASAGVARIGLVTSMPLDDFEQMMNVNLRGVFLLARATMPHLEAGGGSFIAIASDAALNGFQGYAAYCASKHAVLGLIKALALDHGPAGVRSNAICPGYVETPMLDRLLPELSASRVAAERAIPLGRFARPEDIAGLVAFLASDAGAYINGAALPIDGGGAAGPYQPAPPP